MGQANTRTRVTLKALRIQKLREEIAQLESEVETVPCPAMLLDAVILKLNLKNDVALARLLTTSSATISNTRNGKMPIGSGLLIRMHEESKLSIRELKSLAGLKALAGI